MIIDYHTSFDRQFKKLKPRQRQHFKDRLSLFLHDQYNPQLNNHALKGKYTGYRSLNITGDLRAIFIKHAENHIEFVYIGSHSQLYR